MDFETRESCAVPLLAQSEKVTGEFYEETLKTQKPQIRQQQLLEGRGVHLVWRILGNALYATGMMAPSDSP
jgi:hypothetical protein